MSSPGTTDGTLRIVLVVVAALVLAPLLMMVVAFPMMGMWGGMMGGFDGGYAVHPLWGLGMAVVWLAVLVVGGYLVLRSLGGRDAVVSDPALEELRLAYARGDLSEEEFEERRARLAEE